MACAGDVNLDTRGITVNWVSNLYSLGIVILIELPYENILNLSSTCEQNVVMDILGRDVKASVVIAQISVNVTMKTEHV